MKCKHCGVEVQKGSKNCQHCGKRLGMSLMLKVLLSFIGVFVALVIFGQWATNTAVKQLREQPPASTVATIDKSPKMQADRKSLIQRLVDQGIFQKVEMPGNF